MIFPKPGKLLIAGLAALLMLVLPQAGAAAGLTIEEAINRGLANNKDLRALEERIAGLQRELAIIKAQQDLQVGLNAGYRATFPEDGRADGGPSGLPADPNSRSLLSAGISLSKTFPSGLTVAPGISVTEKDIGLSLEIGQPLFPALPTNLSRQYYKTTKELLKAEENLIRQRTEKVLSWLESYLNLCRLKERREIYQRSAEMAAENLEKTLARKQIGEAGENDLLAAEISLRNAEFACQEMDYRIEEALLSLGYELGIDNPGALLIDHRSSFLQELKEAAEKLAAEYRQQNDLLETVKKNNYQLLVNRIDREVLTRELEWLKKENGPALNATGSYNTGNNRLTVGLSLTYKLHDGGERRLRLEEKEAALASNEAAYHDLADSLKLELKKHLHTLELNRLELAKEQLVRQQSQYNAETAEKQLAMGLIDYLEYQEQWLKSKEAEINLGSLEDRLFIANLRFINFINSAELMGGLWHD